MGSEIYLYLTVGKNSIIARVDAGSKAKVGDSLKVAINTNKIHMFDAETEETIF
jgi:multiple sugar transport system ATP-binding protein